MVQSAAPNSVVTLGGAGVSIRPKYWVKVSDKRREKEARLVPDIFGIGIHDVSGDVSIPFFRQLVFVILVVLQGDFVITTRFTKVCIPLLRISILTYLLIY